MAGRAIIAPLRFNDSSLPRVDLTYISPLPNALYDWAVDSLAAGSLGIWPSLVDGHPLAADSGTPRVEGAGDAKAATFNGVNDRMRAAFALDGPRTVVTVHRFTKPGGNDVVHFPQSNSAGGSLGIDGGGATYRFLGNSKYIIPNPYIKPDTGWHVSITVMDGTSSAVRIDNTEFTGDTTGLPATDGLTLGFAAGDALRTAIQYKRVAILAGGMSATARAGLVTRLRDHYNI